jgi:hypothetical protein
LALNMRKGGSVSLQRQLMLIVGRRNCEPLKSGRKGSPVPPEGATVLPGEELSPVCGPAVPGHPRVLSFAEAGILAINRPVATGAYNHCLVSR